jgi:hypothetical protein
LRLFERLPLCYNTSTNSFPGGVLFEARTWGLQTVGVQLRLQSADWGASIARQCYYFCRKGILIKVAGSCWHSTMCGIFAYSRLPFHRPATPGVPWLRLGWYLHRQRLEACKRPRLGLDWRCRQRCAVLLMRSYPLCDANWQFLVTIRMLAAPNRSIQAAGTGLNIFTCMGCHTWILAHAGTP